MTFFLHKASGLLVSNSSWSTGLLTSGSISEAAANTAWASAWATLWGTTGFAALFKTTVTTTAFSTSTASATFKQTTITRSTAALAGTATTGELPDFCCLTVSLYSTSATRYGRGRMFLPAPVAAALSSGTGGHLLSANATTIATALGVFFTGLVTAGLSPTLYSRRAPISGPPIYGTRAITSGSLPAILSVQHRRGDKLVPTRTTFAV